MDIRKVRRNILVWIMIFCFVFAPQKTWGEITENQEKVQQDLVEAPGAVLMEKETGTVIYSKRSGYQKKSGQYYENYDINSDF